MTLRLSIIALLLTTLTAGASQVQDVLMRNAYGVRGTAVSAWTPSNATDVVAWYDASDTSTILATNTTSVTNWLDKSGSGYTLASTTAGSRPVVTNGVFGALNSIYFNGNNWLIRNAGSVFQAKSNGCIFVVSRPKAVSAVNYIFTISTGGLIGRGVLGYNSSSNQCLFGGRRLDTDSFQGLYATNSSITSLAVISAIFNYGSSNIILRVNGSQLASYAFQTPGASANSGSYLAAGSGVNGGGSYLNGWIGEVLVTHSTNDIANIETYLKNKWGTP